MNETPGQAFPIQTAVMLTHVPFWNRRDGAQQRMYSLHRYLVSRDVEVTIFYLQEMDAESIAKLAEQSIHVVTFRNEAQAPGLTRRLLDWFKSFAGNQDAEGSPKTSLTPQDFCWPTAKQQFEVLVRGAKPEIVIAEYVAVAEYISESVVASCDKTILDTHDVLHMRCERFKAKGQSHWLEIDRETEANLLARFDMLLAIQDEEASIFADMCPACDIVVAGHCPKLIAPADESRGDDEPVTIGFLGSDNAPNRDGINWFLKDIWPTVREKCEGQVKLLLAGGFTERPEYQGLGEQGIEMWSQQVDLAQFYGSCEIVINPVRLGTGLKIKSVEALAAGRPLITTPHSALGLPDTLTQLITVSDDPDQFADAICDLVNDRDQLEDVSKKIQRIASNEFSEERIYSGLRSWLEQAF